MVKLGVPFPHNFLDDTVHCTHNAHDSVLS